MLYHLLVELLGNNSEMVRLIMKTLIDVSELEVWHYTVFPLARSIFKEEEHFLGFWH